MTYPGYKELKHYIEQTSKPSFSKFVQRNVTNLADWSFKGSMTTSASLHGFWCERYCMVYKEVYKSAKTTKKTKAYNVLIWNDILAKINRRRKLVDKCSEAALDVIGNVADSAASQVCRALNDTQDATVEESEYTDIEETEGADIEETEDADIEKTVGDNIEESEDTAIDETGDEETHADGEEQSDNLRDYGKKKFLGTFDNNDKTRVQQKITKGISILDRITNNIITLLCKDELTSTEQETLKLLLSNIVNTLDESVYAAMEIVFTSGQLDFICKYVGPESEEHYGLDLLSLAMFDDIVKNCESIGDFLLRVSTEKARLIDDQELDSDCYRMLCILGVLGESLMMPIDDNVSETTFYRRFANLLDYVFSGTNIQMLDGEIVSEATRMAMEQNNYDITSAFGRKIDLLLKVKDIPIELAANEWKSNKTQHLQLKQQSKNLRSNCAILNKLYIESGTKIDTIMAMDVLGSTGYLYKLYWKNGVYATSVVAPVFLPSTLDEIDVFKKTLGALFFWKDFLVNQAQVMKRSRLMSRLNMVARSSPILGASTHVPPPPFTFFTPSRPSKRAAHLMN